MSPEVNFGFPNSWESSLTVNDMQDAILNLQIGSEALEASDFLLALGLVWPAVWDDNESLRIMVFIVTIDNELTCDTIDNFSGFGITMIAVTVNTTLECEVDEHYEVTFELFINQ